MGGRRDPRLPVHRLLAGVLKKREKLLLMAAALCVPAAAAAMGLIPSGRSSLAKAREYCINELKRNGKADGVQNPAALCAAVRRLWEGERSLARLCEGRFPLTSTAGGVLKHVLSKVATVVEEEQKKVQLKAHAMLKRYEPVQPQNCVLFYTARTL